MSQATSASAVRERSGAGGPALLMLGAGVLLFRTIALLAGGARQVLKSWVVTLTYVEMLLDGLTIAGAARWMRSRAPGHSHVALRTGAAATFLHAGRVFVFVLGRTGPWYDFDVRPEKRADHRTRWNWGQVVFAGVMSVLGMVGATAIWVTRRRAKAPTPAGTTAGTSR